MAEGYLNLFVQEDYAGTNRPHYKGFFKIDGIDHEFALWPNREGKKGFSGKFKPKELHGQPLADAIIEKAKEVFAVKEDESEIPF